MDELYLLGYIKARGIYPGKAAYRLTEKVQVLPLADIGETWNYG